MEVELHVAPGKTIGHRRADLVLQGDGDVDVDAEHDIRAHRHLHMGLEQIPAGADREPASRRAVHADRLRLGRILYRHGPARIPRAVLRLPVWPVYGQALRQPLRVEVRHLQRGTWWSPRAPSPWLRRHHDSAHRPQLHVVRDRNCSADINSYGRVKKGTVSGCCCFNFASDACTHPNPQGQRE